MRARHSNIDRHCGFLVRAAPGVKVAVARRCMSTPRTAGSALLAGLAAAKSRPGRARAGGNAPPPPPPTPNSTIPGSLLEYNTQYDTQYHAHLEAVLLPRMILGFDTRTQRCIHTCAVTNVNNFELHLWIAGAVVVLAWRQGAVKYPEFEVRRLRAAGEGPIKTRVLSKLVGKSSYVQKWLACTCQKW